MHLLNGTETTLAKGTWNFKTIANGGTVSITYQQTVDGDDTAPSVMPGTAVSADDAANYDLPHCKVVATLTGGAVVTVSKVK